MTAQEFREQYEAGQRNFTEADLSEADLREADLRWADLRWADLRGADLSKADLREADLRGANLSGADLRGAGLSEADLRGADLSEADLSWADLRGARGVQVFGPAPSSGRMVYAIWQDTVWMVQADCFAGTVSELRARAEAEQWYLSMCDLLEANPYTP